MPFIVLLAFLVYTYKKIGKVKPVKTEKVQEKRGKLETPFYLYIFAVALNALGLIPYELILYKASIILHSTGQWIVPLIYTVIQGVDAPSALLSGYSYDKFKIKVLALPFALSIIPSIIALANADLLMLIIAAVFFGLILGMQESIYRAAVSEFAPISSRGTAYGIFNTVYGVGMLASGAVYGLMATLRPPFILVVLYVIVTQAAAVIMLLKAHSRGKTSVENIKT